MLLTGRWIGDIFEQEVPTGTVNGSNTAFSLSTTPHSAKAVQLFLDGMLLRQTADYSVSGTSLTLVTAPGVGQGLYACYIKKN
jgi:hypothetical protein